MSDHDSTKNVRLPWYLWLFAWLCTSLMGSLFGGLFFLLQGGGLRAFGGGLAIGFYLAAYVGVVVIPLVGLLNWVFRVRGRRSLRLMTIAGGATGFISGLILGPLCLLTCALGAFAAALPGRYRLARTR